MAQWYAERAERWIRSQARRSSIYGTATEIMLELADIRTGRVLDVAAGTGEHTLLAAQLVGPSGYVLATDISTDMLKHRRRRSAKGRPHERRYTRDGR